MSVIPGAREIVVPETVMTPPGVSVCPSTMYVEPPLGAYVIPPMMMEGAPVVEGGLNICVCPLITTAVADGAKLTVVPSKTAVPPGVKVAPGARLNCVAAFAVIVCPATVINGMLAEFRSQVQSQDLGLGLCRARSR